MNLNLKNKIKKLLNTPVSPRKIILLIITVAAVTLTLNALVATLLERYDNFHVPSVGTIYALGFEAYGGNITTRDDTQYVDWGTVYVGTQTNRSLILRSKSNIDTTMNLSAANWTFTNTQGQNVTPPATNPINLTWDYNNSTIKPNQEIPVTLTLSVPYDTNLIEYLITNKVTQFSFDIHIYPTKP